MPHGRRLRRRVTVIVIIPDKIALWETFPNGSVTLSTHLGRSLSQINITLFLHKILRVIEFK